MPLSAKEIEALAKKVGRPRRVRLTVDMERVKEMRRAGFSARQIATALGVGRTTLYRRISEEEGRPAKY